LKKYIKNEYSSVTSNKLYVNEACSWKAIPLIRKWIKQTCVDFGLPLV